MYTTMEAIEQDVREHRNACLWYARGRIDSGQYGDLLSLDGDGRGFADERAEARRKYLAQEVGYMSGVLHAWEAYVARKRDEADAGRE